MKLKNLKPFAWVLLFFTLLTHSQAQILFLAQDFEDVVEDWTIEPADTSTLSWQYGLAPTLSSAYFNIPEHTGIAGVNDDAPGAGFNTSGRLISPPISLTGTISNVIIFDAYFTDGDYNGDDESLNVEIRKNGSDEWERIGFVEGQEDGWQDRLQVSIPESYNDMDIQIAFNYQEGGGWNFGAAIDNVSVQEKPDYDAVAFTQKTSLTTSFPASQSYPFRLEYGIENLGANALENVVFDVLIEKDGQEFDSAQEVIGSVEDAYENEFEFTAPEVGEYTLTFGVREANLGDIEEISYSYIMSDSTFAKDDGIPEQQLGFAFGDPSWYGYYGSEFFLQNPDTLTSIDVFIGQGSDASGTMNFTVGLFNEAGDSPDDEIFHSEEVPLDKNDIGNFKNYQLPEPLPLPAGRFVVATGQDTIQGVLAFGFDDNEPEDAFWIISPVAGGGYPWFYTAGPNGNEVTMLIRPNFGATPTLVATTELEQVPPNIQVSPNPFHKNLHLEWQYLEGKATATIADMTGKIIAQTHLRNNHYLDWQLPSLASGIYILTVQDERGIYTEKVVKE